MVVSAIDEWKKSMIGSGVDSNHIENMKHYILCTTTV